MMAGALALSATAAQAGAIAANSTPITVDPGIGSNLTVSGTLSGLAFYQTNAEHAAPGDSQTWADIDNAMVGIAKTDGFFQFDIQAGLYDFPTVGNPYVKATTTNSSTFGVVPIAYGKFQLSDTFSVSAGKLPTLVGAELPFTTQNINIERGLLWWQEPLVSRGVQANYASGPLSVAVSWNDGYYTNVWNSFSGLISYAFDSANTLAFDTSITEDTHATTGHQLYNLMYTYSSGDWMVGPYAQYESYDHSGGSEWGIGVLAAYQLTPTWSLNGRVEYEDTTDAGLEYAFPVPGYEKADAFSVTFTPTWQKGIYFVRGELSYTDLPTYAHVSFIGKGFGTAGTDADQFRAMIETGVQF
jgi:hypothetical protein